MSRQATADGRSEVSNREKLRHFIDGLEIVDTHEHLPNEAEWADLTHDVLVEWLQHYFSADLVSAGLPQDVLDAKVRNSALPLAGRWRLIEPFWNAARNTGYARALDIAARDLYGIEYIDGGSLEKMNAQFLKRRSDAAKGESYYRHVLKDKSRIAVSINDRLDENRTGWDAEFFRGVLRLEGLIDAYDPVSLEKLASRTGVAIHSLDDFKAAVRKVFDEALSLGAVGFKVPLAYRRPIRFVKVATADAERIFNGLFGKPGGPDAGVVPVGEVQPLEDHMMHFALSYADLRGLPVQVHTGLQEGNGNILANSNPELLVNLLLEYRNVTFDLFHISYPYQNVLAAIAKNFPNVMIDMCWAHIISPEASVRALVEFLDSVPANKISAFGGDYLFPDGVYGHQVIARDNVAKALAIKVDEGVFDLDRACEIARWLFVDNPGRIFGLDK